VLTQSLTAGVIHCDSFTVDFGRDLPIGVP
jgi:hypothetical protein